MPKPSVCFQLKDDDPMINKKNILQLLSYIMRSIICALRRFVLEQLHIDLLSFGILILFFFTITALLLVITFK